MFVLYYLLIGVLVILLKIAVDKFAFKRSFTKDVKAEMEIKGIPEKYALIVALFVSVLIFPIIFIGMVYQITMKAQKK